jgi:hypothetical protein
MPGGSGGRSETPSCAQTVRNGARSRGEWQGESRENDHGHPWYTATGGIDDLPARHSGQRQVGDHEIPGFPSKRVSPPGPSAAIPHSYPTYSRSAWTESRTTGSSPMSRTPGPLVSGTSGHSANAMPRLVWHVPGRRGAAPPLGTASRMGILPRHMVASDWGGAETVLPIGNIHGPTPQWRHCRGGLSGWGVLVPARCRLCPGACRVCEQLLDNSRDL